MKLKPFLLTNRKINLGILLILICIYGLYLRLNLRSGFELHNDEYNQLKVMQGSFMELLRDLPQNEINSYLNWDHFLIYPFFKIFSYNKWGLAFPHILSTILGFYLLYLLCSKYCKTIWGYLIAFGIVCFNYTMSRQATMIRAYPVLPTLALSIFLLWHYINEKIENNLFLDSKVKLLLGIYFIITIWFHSYGILIFSMPLLYFILLHLLDGTFKSFTKKILKFTVIIFCLSMPLWLYCVFGPNVQVEESHWNPFQFIPDPRLSPPGFLKGIFGNLVGERKLYFLLAGIFFPVLLNYKDRVKQLVFLFTMVFLPIGLILLIDIIAPYWFLQRQFIWVMPFFALFLGWSWESLILWVTERIRQKK